MCFQKLHSCLEKLSFHRDLVISAIVVILLFILTYSNLLDNLTLIQPEIFLQIYVTLIAAILTVFAIFTTFGKIIYIATVKKKIDIVKKLFYYPLYACIIGFLFTIFIPFLSENPLQNYIISLNIGILTYSVINLFELFNFIFNLSVEWYLKQNSKKK